jgi:uncharacterized membrane protein YphA (DoxX/SURF4 family)
MKSPLSVFEMSLAFVVRIGSGLLFLIAAKEKWGNFEWWTNQFALLAVTPRGYHAPFAAAAMGMEFLTGALLFVGILTRSALVASAILWTIFAVVLASVLLRGIDVACGCFGPESPFPITWPRVIGQLAVAILCAAISVAKLDPLCLERYWRGADRPRES